MNQAKENQALGRVSEDKNQKVSDFPTNTKLRSEGQEDITGELRENQFPTQPVA